MYLYIHTPTPGYEYSSTINNQLFKVMLICTVGPWRRSRQAVSLPVGEPIISQCCVDWPTLSRPTCYQNLVVKSQYCRWNNRKSG